MKKQLFIVLASGIVLCSCGKNTTDPDQINSSISVEYSTEPVYDSSIQASSNLSVDDSTDIITESEVSKSIDGLATYLVENGVVTGLQSGVDASMIGAISGVKYLDSNVEIYEFDTSSEEYNKIVSTGTIEVRSLDYSYNASAINDKFVLYCEDAENKDNIIKFFSEY